MTPIDRFERQLPMALTDLAVPQTPDYLTDILGQTARTRQRPAWASIERWLPMELVSKRATVARMPWRQLGVLALIALLLAAALAVFVGSQQRRLPPPFGPAANGSLLYAMDGDIFAADPRTGASKAIVTGPEQDVEPVYSLDGTRVLFGRTSSTEPQRLLFVANVDGSGIVQVTPEPLSGISSWSFSPDGRSIVAFASGDQGPVIVVIPSDGKAAPKAFPVFASSPDGGDGPPMYRPDGSEIMFIGKDPGQVVRGVYALNAATGTVRTLVAPSTNLDIHGASWSPDGKYVAYGVSNQSPVAVAAKTHVVGVDGSGDVVVDTDPVHVADFGFDWSNDSTRLIITRWQTADGSKARSAIVPIDRSSAGVEIACPPGANSDDCTAEWTFSPDDSTLQGSIARPDGTTAQFLADPRTGQVRGAPWTGNGHPIWQRLAP
jgi:Tol biopolymer transport system component